MDGPIAVLAGTPVDTRMGVEYLTDRGLPGLAFPVSDGPREQTAAVREAMDDAFKNLAEWLLFGLIDYNYISESLLPIQCE